VWISYSGFGLHRTQNIYGITDVIQQHLLAAEHRNTDCFQSWYNGENDLIASKGNQRGNGNNCHGNQSKYPQEKKKHLLAGIHDVGLLSLKTKNPTFQWVNECPCVYTSTPERAPSTGEGGLAVLEDAKGDTLGTIQTGYSIVRPPMFIFDLPPLYHYRLSL
jgi:hypothetical protein